MKGRVKQGLAALLSVLAAMLPAVSAYADVAYDPIDALLYDVGPILLILVIGIFVISLIAGAVLLIIFSVRRKKRRAATEKKSDEA